MIFTKGYKGQILQKPKNNHKKHEQLFSKAAKLEKLQGFWFTCKKATSLQGKISFRILACLLSNHNFVMFCKHSSVVNSY